MDNRDMFALPLDAAALLQAYDAQGVHRTGHLADAENADWLVDLATQLGADARLESFSMDRIEPADCYVEIAGQRIPGTPVFDGAFTGPAGVEGVLGATVGLETLGPTAIYQPTYEAYRQSRNCTALVTVTAGGGPGLAVFNAERFLQPYDLPNLLVSSEYEAQLAAAAQQGARVRVVCDARRVPSRPSNVVATVAGSDPNVPAVVVMTPRSGWWHCASERGGGIVCWLSALAAVLRHRATATVTFLASTGHELGHVGLHDFMQRRPHLTTTATWLHFGANLGARDSVLTLQSPQDDLRRLGCDALEAVGGPHPALSPPATVPNGESRDIHRAGGRYLTFVGSNALFHLPSDRYPDAVDIPAVGRIAAAAARVAAAMAGA